MAASTDQPTAKGGTRAGVANTAAVSCLLLLWDGMNLKVPLGLGLAGKVMVILHLGISPAVKEEGSEQPGGYPGG